MTPVIAVDNETDVDGTLIAFADAAKSGNASVAEWSGRHPALARDFARIATEIFVGETDETIDAAFVESLRRVGRTRLASLRARYAAPALVSLVDKERGITSEKIAAHLALPVQYVAKLQRRLFAPESLPQTLIQRLAAAIDRTVDEVSAYLAAPPTLARAAAYRSDDAPTLGSQEDFHAVLSADDTVSHEVKTAYSEA